MKAGIEKRYSSHQQHAVPEKVLQHGFSSCKGETNVTAALKHKTYLLQSFVRKTNLKTFIRLNCCSSTASFLPLSFLPPYLYSKIIAWKNEHSCSYSWRLLHAGFGEVQQKTLDSLNIWLNLSRTITTKIFCSSCLQKDVHFLKSQIFSV